MYTITIQREVHAPKAVVWDVISDVERYAEYAPNLSKAHKTSEGLTPSRRCYDTRGRGWNEACVLWEEEKAYSYLVDTSAPDYPYPFSQLKGTWSMEENGKGVLVTMRFDYTPKYPLIFGWLVHRQVQRAFRPIVNKLFDNWEAEIQSRLN